MKEQQKRPGSSNQTADEVFMRRALDEACQALREGETYSKPLYATFRLKDKDETREEKVFLGEIPVMTEDGAFVIHGGDLWLPPGQNRG